MQGWAAQELRYVHLGDGRLDSRLLRMVEQLAAQPTASVPQASGTWADTKATYRFWDSDTVTPDAIRASHTRTTVDRISRESCVLAVQDTTDLDFAHHPATKGLGPLDNEHQYGMKVHSTLAVSTQGVPLGLLHQQVWTRDPATRGIKHTRRKRATKDKESQRWLTALTASEQVMPPQTEVVMVADSEADIYDLFALPRRPGSHVLIRGTHNRRVHDTARSLWAAVRAAPVAGRYVLDLQRADERAARRTTMAMRFITLQIRPPCDRPKSEGLRPVGLSVILVEEEAAPPGVTPVCWLLLSSLPIASVDDALTCVRWYSYRWLIERYHFVLKSGCRLEELQLEDALRLERALATYCLVAWRLLWLTYQARQQPDLSCTIALEQHEWQSLYCTIHRTAHPPQAPPTLHEAVRWIAQLGGFLGRRHDGEPGVKLIWQGLRRLHDIAATWQLMRLADPPLS
jgi:hypothetical protein